MRLTRRQFLTAAPAGGGAALWAGRAWPARRRKRGRVVVVGAGLAGLAAAYELDRSGWEVVVLEARKRIGGRVLTIESNFSDGQYAEAGGEYVNSSHRTLIGYATRFGLRLEDVRRSPAAAAVVYRNGRRRTRAAVETPHVRAEVGRFRRRVDALAARLDPADPVAAGARLDARTAADLLDDLRLDPTARWLVEHEIRDEFTVEADHVSLLFLAQKAKLPSGAAFRIRGGNDRLAQALARGLDLRLAQPAKRIATMQSGVEVDDFAADYCILTVPVRAWGEIDFSPLLPDPLLEAAQKLQYGYGTKTLLQYPQRFWRHDGLSGELLTDLEVSTTWEATARQRGPAGILTAYTVGGPGLVYTSVETHSRILLAADEIDDVFPDTRPLVSGGATAAWLDERYSRGTYVAYNRGQVVKYWHALRRPLGRLYFAGEHTDARSGTMEGALRSGRRAAAAIVARGT